LALLSILICIEYRESCDAFAATLLAAGEEPNSQKQCAPSVEQQQSGGAVLRKKTYRSLSKLERD
jgi:hypothetical protein